MVTLRGIYMCEELPRRHIDSRLPVLTSSADRPREAGQQVAQEVSPQTLALSAAAGNALTILRAGLAFTTHSFPKISFFPALVAGFTLTLNLQRPGIEKSPVLVTSVVAMLTRLSIALLHTFFFSSHAAAIFSAIAPLVIALGAFAFMGAI